MERRRISILESFLSGGKVGRSALNVQKAALNAFWRKDYMFLKETNVTQFSIFMDDNVLRGSPTYISQAIITRIGKILLQEKIN